MTVAPDLFRQAMQNFPAGVTIVTATDAEGAPVGATVSAFCSLSLDPPLVLVCLTNSSRTTAAIRQRGAFVIHFLGTSDSALARLFAADLSNKFEEVTYHLNSDGVPCLDDAGMRLECSLHEAYDGGDHRIVVGRVQDAHVDTGFEPLIYARRGFYSLRGALET